jgi:tetratricopeptide (TPR) repeat protein
MEARRIELARRLYGANSPVTLKVMLDQAWDDDGFDDYGKANAVLAEDRDRILATFGSHSHERGLWLMERAYALSATPGARDEGRRDASEAAAIFASESPVPDDYPTAKDIFGRFEMDSDRFPQALKDMDAGAATDRALGEFDPVEQIIYNVHSAEALQNLGALGEAERRYRVAAMSADRTMGRRSSLHFDTLVQLADLLRQRGERAEADRILQQLDSEVDGADTPRGQALRVKEIYGAALVAEGRAAAAMPVLGAALTMARTRPHSVAQLPRIQQAMGEAEEQLGRRDAAGQYLTAARTAWMREGPANAPWVLGARERWARFEIASGAAAVATAECQAIVRAGGATPSAPVALAQADLARLALQRGDIGAARDESATALKTMSAASELYDIRSWIPVWRARALVLSGSGDGAGARAWAKRASDAALRYGGA